MTGFNNFSVCNGPCLCCAGNTPLRIGPSASLPYYLDHIVNATEEEMGLKKRPPSAGDSKGQGLDWTDPEFQGEYPHLYSFLYDPTYEDGTTRLTGSMSVFTKLGVLTVALNDNDQGQVAFINAPTWSEMMSLLEMAICDDSTVWKSRTPKLGDKKPPF